MAKRLTKKVRHHIKKSTALTISNPFKRIQRIFENNIFLREVSIKEVGRYAQKYDKKTLGKMKDALNKKLKNRKGKARLSNEDLKIIQETLKKHPAQSDLFTKNTLVSIVSTLDVLFVELFKFYYKKFPEKLSLENQTIRFKDLKNITKIEDAQNFLITREIETILVQEGIASRLNTLSHSMGFDISPIDKSLADVKKLVKIRNLIVHNDGIADSEYNHKYGDKENKVGDKIRLSHKYLTDSLYLVYFLGTYILQGAQLHFSEKIESREFLLNNVLHELIKNGQHGFSRHVYDFALNNKIDSLNKKLITINYCIGLKKQGKTVEHIQKVLNLEDWSIKKEDFEMCKAALLEKHADFYFNLERLIKDKKITKNEIDDWIVFHFYKNKPRFKSLVKKIKC